MYAGDDLRPECMSSAAEFRAECACALLDVLKEAPQLEKTLPPGRAALYRELCKTVPKTKKL